MRASNLFEMWSQKTLWGNEEMRQGGANSVMDPGYRVGTWAQSGWGLVEGLCGTRRHLTQNCLRRKNTEGFIHHPAPHWLRIF